MRIVYLVVVAWQVCLTLKFFLIKVR